MRSRRLIFARAAGALCALLLLALCSAAVYDRLSPWTVASRELEHYGKHCTLCFGISSSSYAKSDGVKSTSVSLRQRAYALMRFPVSWPVVVLISQNERGQVAVQETALGFWFLAAITGGLGWGAWRLLARPLLRGQPAGPTNQAAAVDAPIASLFHAGGLGRRATAQRRSN